MEKYILATFESLEEKLSAFPYTQFYKYNLIKEYEMLLNFMKDKKVCSYTEYGIEIDKVKFNTTIKEFLDAKNSIMNRATAKSYLKNVFKIQEIPFNRRDFPYNDYEEFKDVDDKIMTYNEFVIEINSLFNESEKLLAYMAFKDLLGENSVNARFAKVEDIDFENKIWKLYDGREIKLEDKLLIILLKNTINQKKYLPYDKKIKKTDAGVQFPSAYPYNMNSPYLMKTRIHTRTNDGLSPFSKVGLEAIFKRLVIEFGEMWYKNNLKVSGFLDEMYQADPSPSWTVARIDEFKKRKNAKVSSNNARVFFLQKYFPADLINAKK